MSAAKPLVSRPPLRDGAGVVATREELIALQDEPIASARPRSARVATRLAGAHASRFRGRSMEFSEVRAYQVGDDVRAIDWRVTARTGRPHSKVFEEERERPTWLLCDLGPSMRFGTRGAFKSVAAARVAALLAREAFARGERIGGIVAASGSTVELPPGRTRGHLLRLLDALANGTAAGGDAPADRLDKQLQWIAPRVRPGSHVTLVSDFYGLDEALELALRVLARRCDVTLVHVFDALEATQPPAGRYRVSDGRAIASVESGRGSAWERATTRDFEQRSRALLGLALRQRIELLSLRTDQDPAQVLSAARARVARRSLA